jgi:hypothetical protein
MRTWRKLSMAGWLAVLVLALASSSVQAILVPNGGFESGNQDFTSAYGYVASTGHNTLQGEGLYAVGYNPYDYHASWASYGDHTSGTGKMMIVNGAGSPVDVWTSSAITVAPNTLYYFSVWVASSYSESPANLVFKVNGTQMGSDFTASATTGVWQQFYCTWYSGAQSSASLYLYNRNTALSGNDFTLDDIALETFRPEGATGVGGTVPLPSTVLLLGSGLVGLLAWRRRNRG